MKHAPQPRPSQDSGIALVIVLSALVLLTAITMAFFVSVTAERTTAAQFQDSVTTRLLADTAINVVIGQIQEGTNELDTAWASQPGAIRTFDSAGALSAIYKLYSSDALTVSSAGVLGNDSPDDNWADDPGSFTDLNEPVRVQRGMNSRLHYPILDPAAATEVEGFTLGSLPGATAAHPLPMPVRWMYVLRDGQFVSATGAPVAPSAGNPIVGRVAFWTDDETTKININTAAGGSAWDVPRAYTRFDFEKGAQYPPAQHEVQRYPGHPATTSLRPVFPGLTPREISFITPRIQWGGSEGGTKNSGSTGFEPIDYDEDRLYATFDELLLQPERDPNAALLDEPVTPESFQQQVEMAGFFLTPHSRAPETNLFNRPRVTMWPVSNRLGTAQESDYTTIFDRSIALVSQIGRSSSDVPYDYFFRRQDAYSRNADWDAIPRNRQLLGYLFQMTNQPIPGFGGSFRQKYGQDATNSMPRDRILVSMFDYIRGTNIADPTVDIPYSRPKGSGDPPPGYGQIVPSVINVSSLPGASNLSDARGLGRFPTISEAGLWFIAVGDSTNPAPGTSATEVAALAAGDLVQVQAVFIAQFFDPSNGFPVIRPDFTMRVQGLNHLEYQNPEGGWQSMGFTTPGHLHINAYSPFYHHGRAMGGIIDIRMLSRYFPDPSSNPGSNIARQTGAGPQNFPFVSAPIALPRSGQFKFRTVPAQAGQIQLFNGNSTDSAQQVQVFTNLRFPETEVPVPTLPAPENDRTAWLGTNANTGHNSVNKRFRKTGGTDWNFILNGEAADSSRGIPAGLAEVRDVVRTFVLNPERADPRVVALNGVATMNLDFAWRAFNKHALYDGGPTIYMAHSLRTGRGEFFAGGSGGFFVQPSGFDLSTSYQSLHLPEVPRGAISVQPGNFDYIIQPPGTGVGRRPGATPGDWDNGIGSMFDGTFSNKPDEGAFITSTGQVPYFQATQTFANLPSTHFSPNRQVPSPVMFGSLPSGIFGTQTPYRTLLFRPDPLDGTNRSHYGGLPPKDHLLLDLFHMPVVEPYAISEPFSTAGKINMNYQILPFGYIKRDTGLRGILESEQLLVIPNSAMSVSGSTVNSNYKRTDAGFFNLRYPIEIDRTLAQFDERFAANDIFRSATEICDIHLVPDDGSTTLDSMRSFSSFWEQRLLTGDNTRERPYANIYPRLTTKSNTYTVHYRVQTLRKVPSTPVETWVEGTDLVMGEYRGSTTIERYIDPNDPGIPDYTLPANFNTTETLDKFYKFRVLSTKQFNP